MSENEAIVVSQPQAIMASGVGLGAGIFQARPLMLELVHKTSRQENVKFGEFRIIATNEHLGNSIRAVLLAVPQEQREWFRDPNVFTRDNKACFSLDGIRPHERASDPPAMFCKTCSKGDINWEKWRKTKLPADLPPCGAYWHLLIADRNTQAPYYMNIKGKSYLPFRQAMQTQMSGLLAKLFANVKAENKRLGYTLVSLRQGDGPVYQEFRPTPGTTPTGPVIPMPNIFDISFDIYSFAKDGGPFQMGFKNFALMKPEDKAEFGQLYLDLLASKVEVAQSTEEMEANAEVTEPIAAQGTTGEVMPPEDKITI